MRDVITYAELHKIFSRDNYPNLEALKFRDSTYLVPAKEWFDEFFIWHEEVVELLNTKGWKPNNDCDDKSTGLRWLASVCNGQRGEENPAEGIAIGEVSYKIDNGGWHAINVAIVGKDHEVRFIEPQRPGWVTLSKAEIKSIRFVMF
jgi:hypothetical protein